MVPPLPDSRLGQPPRKRTRPSLFIEKNLNYPRTICSIFLAVGLGTLSANAQTVRGTPADEQAIRQLIEKHASSARKDDVAGMISTMHADAVTRLDDGQFLVGSAANAKFFQDIVAGKWTVAEVRNGPDYQ